MENTSKTKTKKTKRKRVADAVEDASLNPDSALTAKGHKLNGNSLQTAHNDDTARESDAKQAKKKSKKSKKAKRDQDVDTVAEELKLKDSIQPEGKAKSDVLDSSGEAGDAENLNATVPKKKKKQKKKQKLHETSHENGETVPRETNIPAAGPRGLASVGDASLAKTSAEILKCTYREHREVTCMTSEDVDAFLKDRQIALEGGPTEAATGPIHLRPVTQFSHLGLPDDIAASLSSFSSPSPVQAQCWPLVLQGLDLIGIAATGSGKTLAFGLPALQHVRTAVANSGDRRGPAVLCMAPTRELAQQISTVLQEAGEKCGVRTLAVFGGMPKRQQAADLRTLRPHIIVGTPGRTLDLMQDGSLTLQGISYLVLDEADRMLDKGFEDSIRAIGAAVRSDRQTLMFSATWPPAVQKLAAEFLVDPVKVTIGATNLAASHSVSQTVHVIEERAKDPLLSQLLQKFRSKSTNSRIMVFVLYKKEAPRVERFLRSKGWNAAAIHGDISQEARNRAVEQFSSGEVPLLVATDVAARGLDIPDVELVINYSFPLTVEDYVHRIGRTGRAGKTGASHTMFVGAHDKAKAGELVNVLREANQEVPQALMRFGTAVKKKESKLYGAHFKSIDMSVKSKKVVFD